MVAGHDAHLRPSLHEGDRDGFSDAPVASRHESLLGVGFGVGGDDTD